MEAKAFEIRDAKTFIPALGVLMVADAMPEVYLLRRSGYTIESRLVMLVRMDANGSAKQASYDPYDWGGCRTMGSAHRYITENWNQLRTGAVIDVQFILGETCTPKESESKETMTYAKES
jgi:hypothetical protein